MTRLFGAKLRSLRRRHAMKQAELAERLGLASQGYIANLEAGQEVPSLDLVVRVARVFDVSSDYLLRDAVPVEGKAETGVDRYHASGTLPGRFGEKVRTLRLEKGLSQRELARNLGLSSRAYISDLEASSKMPSLELVVQIADLFGVTTDYLLRESLPVGEIESGTED